jgi:hypothetical protein
MLDQSNNPPIEEEDEDCLIPGMIDLIEIDMFQVQAALFIDLDCMIDQLISLGTDADNSWRKELCRGMAAHVHDESGSPVLALYIAPDSPVSVWVHEISHLVDFIFDIRGISPCAKSTETRAYMNQFIFEIIENAMANYRMSSTDQDDIQSLSVN